MKRIVIQTTLGMFAFLLFIEIAFLSTAVVFRTNPGLLADILGGEVIEATNSERIAQGVAPLISNTRLETAAQRKAEAMAREGYFSHVSPQGKTPWTWLREEGYEFSAAGENLAVNFFDSKDVARAWMNSVTHRANMINRTFTEVGIGVAEGPYKGRNAIFVVQFFGTPLRSSGFVPPTPSPTPTVTHSPPAPAPAPQPQPIPTQTAPSLQAPFITQVLGSVHATSNYMLLMLGTLSLLILILALFMKMHIHHPRTLVQGSILLIVIGALFLLNYYISMAHTEVL